MRTYKQKTDRGKTSESLLRQAANAVIKDGRKIKSVARKLEICHMTLHRFVQLTPAKTNASVFNPEVVKPLPNAPPRLQRATIRRIRKTAVLTDTPEKNALAEEQSKKKAKKNEDIAKKGKGKKYNNKGNAKGKQKGKEKAQEKAKRRVLQESDSDSDKDLEWYCIICCDSYSNSLPREQWIECSNCKNWALVKCIKKGDSITYVCPNCDSDEDMSDE